MSENVNITQLPLTTSMQNTDTMVVISDGKAKRFSYGNLAGNLSDWSSITNKVFDTYDKEYFNTYLSEVNNTSQNVLTFKPDSLNTHINGLIQEGVWDVLTSGNGIAIGKDTVASGDYSFAEGLNTYAMRNGAHSEGNNTAATGEYSHVEGSGNLTVTKDDSGVVATINGSGMATGNNSHCEGYCGVASGNNSHAEGAYCLSSGSGSHAEGQSCKATSDGSHAEGLSCTASGTGSHAEGAGSTASGTYSHAEGHSTASGDTSHAEGTSSKATGTSSHSECVSTASGDYSHSEGAGTASGTYSHSEGAGTTASGAQAHAEGGGTYAIGTNSHAEGGGAYALGVQAHAEGSGTAATGLSSHSEGIGSATAIKDSDGNITGVNGTGIASGKGSHVEGIQCNASGDGSHSGGENSVAAGVSSFAHGIGTVVNHDGEVAFGSYNQSNEKTIFSVGNGTAEARSNIFEVDSDGNVYAKKFIGETTGGTTISDWAANTDYEIGNLVINGNILYKCITSHTSGETFDETESVNWTVLSGEQGVKGDDGISPTATVEQTELGCTVVVTDASGVTTANLTNGTTPHIDETTKHWKIGDVDTGVVAEAVTDINYVFSTDEQVAGTWIDGRTIYKKTIIFNAPSQSTSGKTVVYHNHDISDIDLIWFGGESFWSANNAQHTMSLTFGLGDDLNPIYTYFFSCAIDAAKITIQFGSSYSNVTVYATVMYVKNNS